MENLELRMYGLLANQLSSLQKGLQFANSVVEYSIQHNTEEYLEWAVSWKKYTLLDGGTTNSDPMHSGILNQYALELSKMNVPISCFYDEDLGYQLTSVCFIVDERVFNFEKYPDYNIGRKLETIEWEEFIENREKLFDSFSDEDKELFMDQSEKDIWIHFIGGYRNYQLREFLKKIKPINY